MNREQVKRRLLEQEGYVKKVLSKRLVDREKFSLYKKYLEAKLVKAIIGPRRSGKTTLGMLLLEKKSFYYVNFDDEVLAMTKQEELGSLLEILNELFGRRKYVFLDEIQNIESWELFVNRLQRIGFNIVISGSNSKLLSTELSSHLGGRVFTLEVLPFSFTEFLKATGEAIFEETDVGIGMIKNRLKEFMLLGGYPEILLEVTDPELRKNYYEEIFNTVIFKDVSKRFNIRHTSELVSLANILMNQFSARTSLTRLSGDLGISVHTVKKYLSYYEEAYLFLSSKKFSYKPREMETSFKKYYCVDTGLLNSKRATLTVDFGKLLENGVAVELKRRGFELYYCVVDDQYEADFVVRKGNLIKEVVQVVDDENNLPKRELKTGILACKSLKCNKLTIITWNKEDKLKEGGVNICMVPLWRFLLHGK